jgi:hypothetical protein
VRHALQAQLHKQVPKGRVCVLTSDSGCTRALLRIIVEQMRDCSGILRDVYRNALPYDWLRPIDAMHHSPIDCQQQCFREIALVRDVFGDFRRERRSADLLS